MIWLVPFCSTVELMPELMQFLFWTTGLVSVDAKTFCNMAGTSPVFLTPVHSTDLFFTDLFIWRLRTYLAYMVLIWKKKSKTYTRPSSTLLKLFSLYFGVMAVYLNFRAGVDTSIKSWSFFLSVSGVVMESEILSDTSSNEVNSSSWHYKIIKIYFGGVFSLNCTSV